MADPSPSPDTGADSGAAPSHASSAAYPGTPRWVIVSGIIVLALVLVFGGLHLAGRGMGPMNHTSSMSGH